MTAVKAPRLKLGACSEHRLPCAQLLLAADFAQPQVPAVQVLVKVLVPVLTAGEAVHQLLQPATSDSAAAVSGTCMLRSGSLMHICT